MTQQLQRRVAHLPCDGTDAGFTLLHACQWMAVPLAMRACWRTHACALRTLPRLRLAVGPTMNGRSHSVRPPPRRDLGALMRHTVTRLQARGGGGGAKRRHEFWVPLPPTGLAGRGTCLRQCCAGCRAISVPSSAAPPAQSVPRNCEPHDLIRDVTTSAHTGRGQDGRPVRVWSDGGAGARQTQAQSLASPARASVAGPPGV